MPHPDDLDPDDLDPDDPDDLDPDDLDPDDLDPDDLDPDDLDPDGPGSGDQGDDGVAATESVPRAHPAVYARNWRTVLVIDAAMGLLVVVAGVVVAVAWNLVAGGLLGSLGIAYVFAVVRRGREWGQLRRDAGL